MTDGPADDFEHLDATAQSELIASGQVTPTELVEAAIARLEARNPALNAVIHPDLEKGSTTSGRRSGRRTVPGRAVPPQGPGRQGGRRPFHEGNVHLKEIGYTAPEDQAERGPCPRRG